jgi:tetratricopeptide (TPR) repeat protein
MGEMDTAFSAMRRAQELDPVSPVINTNLGVNYYYQRLYEPAIRQFREALEIDSGYEPAHYRLALALLQQGATDEARSHLERASGVSGASSRLKVLWATAMMRLGQPKEAAKVLGELLASARQHYISPVSIALLFLGLNDSTSALQWLEKAWEENDARLVDLTADPSYDSLRGSPRFQNLLGRMKLRCQSSTSSA